MSQVHVPPANNGITTSRLLALPLELRLQICNYVLEQNASIATFSTAKLVGSHAEIAHRLANAQTGRSPLYEHIPEYHIPVVEPRYEQSLLSKVQPAKVHAGSRIRCEELGMCEYSPVPPILLVNKQIHEEIMGYLTQKQSEDLRKFSLYISYPYGLHVFNSIGSHLLSSAHTVNIAGEYSNISFSAARAAKVPDERAVREGQGKQGEDGARMNPSDARATAAKQSLPSPDELSELVASVLGPQPKVAQLQLRVYYPGSSSYSAVWGDDDSPTVVALRNIFRGNIIIEIWRGREGTGVKLTARPSHNNQRTVSTIWKRLDEGNRAGEKEIGSWIVDPEWPNATIITKGEPHNEPEEGRSVVMSLAESDSTWLNSQTAT